MDGDETEGKALVDKMMEEFLRSMRPHIEGCLSRLFLSHSLSLPLTQISGKLEIKICHCCTTKRLKENMRYFVGSRNPLLSSFDLTSTGLFQWKVKIPRGPSLCEGGRGKFVREPNRRVFIMLE